MTKQEFLSANLPYGLKIYYPTNAGDIQTLLPMHFDCKAELINCSGKPIVRPLSDLTKECVQKDYNEGKPFVPIVELAKLCWDKNESPNLMFQSLKDNTIFIAFSDKKNVFGYDSNTNSFFGAKNGIPVSVVNQLELFHHLILWHFDLITEDCEKVYVTEEFNPYK